jgi:hypothetical protein
MAKGPVPEAVPHPFSTGKGVRAVEHGCGNLAKKVCRVFFLHSQWIRFAQVNDHFCGLVHG